MNNNLELIKDKRTGGDAGGDAVGVDILLEKLK